MEENPFFFETAKDPCQVGISAKALARARTWIEEKTGTSPYGCMILRKAKVAAQWYSGGFSANSLFEIGSIRKSFNSALIGIGIKLGIIDINVRAADVWPEIIKISGDPADGAITLHQLASSVSGWLTPDPPGYAFRYNNAAFTAAEKVVARLFGFADDELAAEVVRRFKIPLKAESWHVYHFSRQFAAHDIDNPGPKLAIDSTLKDLIKWGYLWLNKGIWEGTTLIPSDYVKLATSIVNPDIPDAYYGYNWFVNFKHALWPDAPEDSYGHAGWGTFKVSGKDSRTYLWICPSLETVAAIVTDSSVGVANDFLEVPMGMTAEWIGRIVRSLD
ncbi:MAG: beta-lactamase family protein [Deltaproteobacteria bacterium]|nr:beta-lactamase family protein [Deltaproteobacteria bacterium]MBW1995167.1 beta-lactamase family protein [Deltaproteobacteria bacterium]